MCILSTPYKESTNYIRMCGELACLLEVSASPKPGNVHRYNDFKDLRYEDFLASSVSLGYWLEELALKGLLLRDKKIQWNQLKLGDSIKSAIQSSNFFHERVNVNLGIILLLCPLAVSAGLSYHEDRVISLMELKVNTQKVLNNTTIEDSVLVSEGIALALPGGLGKVERYDISQPSFRIELVDDNVTMLQLMRMCAQRDNICFELSEGFPITFDCGINILTEVHILTKDINLAIINTYLGIMSKYPDTLISRKFGFSYAKILSQKAKKIFEKGGAITVDGRMDLEELDIELQEEDEKHNPGTTADLVAASVFVYLLTGGKLWK